MNRKHEHINLFVPNCEKSSKEDEGREKTGYNGTKLETIREGQETTVQRKKNITHNTNITVEVLSYWISAPMWPVASWLRPNHSNSSASLPLVWCCLNTIAISGTLQTVLVLSNYVTDYTTNGRMSTLNLRVIWIPLFVLGRSLPVVSVPASALTRTLSPVGSLPFTPVPFLHPRKIRFFLFILSFTCKRLLDEACLRVS